MRKQTLVWLSIVLVGASCFPVLEQTGTKPPVVEGGPCAVDANCDDGNPCTTEICPVTTLVCEYTKQSTGSAQTSAQTPEDCKTIVCNDGEPSEVDDSQDITNDNNSCTTDACVAGTPINEVLMDGASCTQGIKTGQCQAGTCTITCANNNDCNDGNACSEDFCNTSTSMCVYTNLDGVPTPGVTPIVGDCKLHRCENGADTESNDDADITEDNNPCTFDVCTNGVPENNNVPEATQCTPGDVNVCDGVGACVPCTVASHCVGIFETECEKRSCVNNKCEIAYEGQTTLASPVLQANGDCQKVVCNGNMGATSLPDNADLPIDANLCTQDICMNGVPSHPFEAANFVCGSDPAQYCNATGQCVGCTSAMQCMGTDDFCKTRTCTGGVCGFSYTPNGTDLPMMDQTAGDCKVRECDGVGTIKSSPLTTDVPVDGNACTQDLCSMGGNPSNPATPINYPCSVGMNDACDGNMQCKKSIGKTCGNGPECVSANCVDGVCCNNTCTTLCRSCNVPGSVGTCADVPKGQDDTGCSGPTQSCNGPNDCDDENGQPCAATSACLSNFCADGVCCESACNTACKSCNVAAGTPGQCANLPSGSTDNAPTNLCVGSSQCDGMGICKKILGATCGVNNECLSGNCVDNVCCADMCTGECKACNVPNLLGVCSNVPLAQDDVGTCSGSAVSCDGTGVCKTEQGGTCAGAAQCFSGFCVDSVCCNNACSGLCDACTSAKSGMTNGACNPVTMGTDPDNECAVEMVSTCDHNGFCDGASACQNYVPATPCSAQSCTGSTQTDAGACNGTGTCVTGTTDCAPYICGATGCKVTCFGDGDCVAGKVCIAMACVDKQANGATCTAANQCTSNNCVDGVCCSTSSCSITCQGCNVNGNGTCSNLPLFTDDTNAPTTCTGNNTCNGGSGSGACKKKIGQTCNNNGECASNNCNTVPNPDVCAP